MVFYIPVYHHVSNLYLKSLQRYNYGNGKAVRLNMHIYILGARM
jgi:hypothetical protein